MTNPGIFPKNIEPSTTLTRFLVIMLSVMKRWIACLAPWMVLTAACAASYQPASAQLTFNSPTTTETFRLGDQCFVTPKVAKSWGWAVELIDKEFQIATEGRLFRLPIQRNGEQNLVNLTDAARYLGAIGEWQGNTFQIISRVRNVEVTPQGLQIDSTLKVRTKFFRLTSPDRFIIDLVGGRMDTPQDLPLPAWWRLGQFNPSTARIVLEHPAAVAVSTPKSADSRQIVITLPSVARQDPSTIKTTIQPIATAPKTSTPAPKRDPVRLSSPTITPEGRNGVAISIPADIKVTDPPSVQYITPTELQITVASASFGANIAKEFDEGMVTSMKAMDAGASATMIITTRRPMAFTAVASGKEFRVRLIQPSQTGSLAGKVIVIDPGHGGHDSGARYGDLYEKNIVLPISRQLRDLLTDQGASVIMTRDGDSYPSLGGRAEAANRSNAACFISIHVNSIQKENSRSGGMTFYHQQDPYDRLLAECIQDEIAKVSNIPDLGTWSDRRIYQSGFKVLRDSNVPSVLIELGFINHKHDRAQLSSPDFSNRIAQAIFRGVKVFLGEK
jgi:N-acetylmuramoyl-L-alanine amidase